jgi:hypothetical protein
MTVARRRNGHAHKRAVPLAQRNTMLSTGGGGRHVVLDFTDLLMEASLPLALISYLLDRGYPEHHTFAGSATQVMLAKKHAFVTI